MSREIQAEGNCLSETQMSGGDPGAKGMRTLGIGITQGLSDSSCHPKQ